jgi:hypothetical protein
LNWHDQSSDEEGFRLTTRHDTTLVRTDNLPPNTFQFVVTNLVAGTTYHFRLVSFNAVGESDSAAETTAQTTGFAPPEPPIDVHAEALSTTIIQVGWTPVGTSEYHLISRRTPSTGWVTLALRPAIITSYLDSTAGPISTYYYRVGAQSGDAVSWSLDSAAVTTPDGAPAAPDSLRAHATVGAGVTLTWRDLSNNEDGFQISRGLSGQGLTLIGSVGENITAYFDPLADIGNYNYRVCSFNAFGATGCTAPVAVRYDFCSYGIIPLCRNNWWEYRVSDTTGPDLTIRRQVVDLQYPTGNDFYLLAQGDGLQDSMYFLRNDNTGCLQLDYPLSGNPTPILIFQYPAAVGNYFFVEEDCVLVAGVGLNLQVNGTLYEDCYAYQRFYSPAHTSTTYIKPETVGVVREVEWMNDEQLVQRDLMDHFVQNN